MSISEELKGVEDKYNEDARKKMLMQYEERKTREENTKKKREEEKRKKNEERIEKIKAILYETSEGIDEPHLYTVQFDHLGRDGAPAGIAGAFLTATREEPGTRSYKKIMTEREVKMIAELAKLGMWLDELGRYNLRSIGNIRYTINNDEKETEKREIEIVRAKVEAIKSCEEMERRKEAQIRFEDGIIIYTDDEHAALCSINCNKENVMLSDDLAREEEERKAAEKKSHPVKYTFKAIKDALHNRNRGRE